MSFHGLSAHLNNMPLSDVPKLMCPFTQDSMVVSRFLAFMNKAAVTPLCRFLCGHKYQGALCGLLDCLVRECSVL